jgi:hypothetical protein
MKQKREVCQIMPNMPNPAPQKTCITNEKYTYKGKIGAIFGIFGMIWHIYFMT